MQFYVWLLLSVLMIHGAAQNDLVSSSVNRPYISIPAKCMANCLHYTIGVGLGSQIFDLIVDTGSGNTVVFDSSFCRRASAFQIVHPHCFNLSSHQFTFQKTDMQILMVDGLWANLSSAVLGADSVSFPTQRLGFNSTHLTAASGTIIVATLPANESGLIWPTYWNGTDGTIGFSHRYDYLSSKDAVPYYFPTIVKKQLSGVSKFLVALDFNDPSDESFIHIGGDFPDVEPAEGQPWVNGGTGRLFHEFNLYGLSICGTNIFSNYSSSWRAIIDTGASCLMLPGDFYDMVMAWVPVFECVAGPPPPYSALDSPTCYLREDIDRGSLPALSFKLSEDSKNFIYVPLVKLLVETNETSTTTGSRRVKLCLVRGPYISYSDKAIPYISFGTLTLRNIFAVLDMGATGVALKSKSTAETSTPLCAAAVKCLPAQGFYRPKNRCMDPDCSKYFIHENHPESRQCVVQKSFLAAGIFVLAVFAVSEIVLMELYLKLSSQIMTDFPPLVN